MLDFRVQNVVPPGGRYFYEVPGTRYSVEDFTMTGLLSRVRKHMHENNLPIADDLECQVKDYMCRRLPTGFCLGDSNTPVGIKIYTMAEVRNNTLVLGQGNGFVTPGEATTRAQVCGKCALNDRSACPTCTGMVTWAVRFVGGRSTGYEQILGICVVDGTLIPAKIFLANIPGNPGYPATCWRTP